MEETTSKENEKVNTNGLFNFSKKEKNEGEKSENDDDEVTSQKQEKNELASFLNTLQSKASEFTSNIKKTDIKNPDIKKRDIKKPDVSIRPIIKEELIAILSEPDDSIRKVFKEEFDSLLHDEDVEAQIKANNERELEPDTYTLMMMNKVCSLSWMLGIFGAFTQFSFVIAIVISLLRKANGCQYDLIKCNLVDIPVYLSPELFVTQAITMILVVASQTDLLRSLQNVIEMRGDVPWDETIGENGNKRLGLWFRRIFFPNILKFLVGISVLVASFLVIVESNDVIELLKDFTALMVISGADDMLFSLGLGGYFGKSIAAATLKAKSATFFVAPRRTYYGGYCFRQLTFLVLTGAMINYWLFFCVFRQWNGKALQLYFPDCNSTSSSNLGSFGNGICDYDGIYNRVECGWDGGDCTIPAYPRCYGIDPDMIGDGECTLKFNTTACGFDGGDCLS